jgi:hypothetical protein
MSVNREPIPTNERRLTYGAMAACGVLLAVGLPVVGSFAERFMSGENPCVQIEGEPTSTISSAACRVGAALLDL